MSVEIPAGEGIVRSLRPFHDSWRMYYEVGWFPIPLRPRQKQNLNEGVTGSKNPFPATDAAKLELLIEWSEGGSSAHGGKSPAQANIGLWLSEEVVAIDVDNYSGKPALANLIALEKRLGKLPKTWTSSARSDGVSGIRFFRIPAKHVGKLHWNGKAAEGIDVAWRGYRYAAVWPSWNPAADAEYLWYIPGDTPDGKPNHMFKFSNGGWQIKHYPAVTDLPFLPESWVAELTNGGEDRKQLPIDMQSSYQAVLEWATDNFRLAKGKPCREVRKRLASAKEAVEDNPTSHDKLTDGHWSIFNCGLEGHQGVLTAVQAFEHFWINDVVRDQEKRSLQEAKMEVFRSRPFHKLKGKEDSVIKELGASLVGTICSCPAVIPASGGALESAENSEVSASAKSDSQSGSENVGRVREPDEYDRDDDGNGLHLMDLFGKDLMYVPGYGKWMKWNSARWELDDHGFIVRRCYRLVRDRQRALALACLAKQEEVLLLCDGDTKDPNFVKAKITATAWRDWSKRSGMNVGANGAIEAAQHNDGASIEADRIDSNERLLGVDNGVLELCADGPAKFRKARQDDYVVYNTGVKYLEPADLASAGGDVAKGRELWKQYLDRFVPDLELCHFIQKALGYCLLGSNEQRLAIFLYGGTSTGKSTMLNAVVSALGQYAETVDLAIFKEKASGLNPALAQAMPRRIITSSEAGMQNHLHADLFKRMTGNDRMSAELKGVNVIVTRIPAFTPIIATNSPPTIKCADAALYKRLLVIPFNVAVDEEHDEKSASVELARFGSEAVLSWLVDGWAMYAQEGLDRKFWPAIVRGETESFGSNLNDLGQFVAERVLKKKAINRSGGKGRVSEWVIGKNSVRVKDVYDMYQRWCTSNNVHSVDVLKPYSFGLRMVDLGFLSKNIWDPEQNKAVRCYVGMALADFEIDGKVANLNVKSRGE